MKTLLSFPNGPTIEADILKKTQRFAVHKSLNSKRGYVITDIASFKCLLWFRTQAEAKRFRKGIEEISFDAVRSLIEKLSTFALD